MASKVQPKIDEDMFRLWVHTCEVADDNLNQAMEDPHTQRYVPGAIKFLHFSKNRAVWTKKIVDVHQFHQLGWKGPGTYLGTSQDGIVDGAAPYFRKVKQSNFAAFGEWPDHVLSTMWVILLEDDNNGSLVIAVVRAGVKLTLTTYPQGLKFTGILIPAPSQLPGFIRQHNLHDPHNTGAWRPQKHIDTIVIV
jgi:hypothetical protein